MGNKHPVLKIKANAVVGIRVNSNDVLRVEVPGGVEKIGHSAFFYCTALTSLTLPNGLTSVGSSAFCGCKSLASVLFKPTVPSVFIVWAMGSTQNRANWRVTTIKNLRNVLALVTAFALERRRDVGTVDPGGRNNVFKGCHKLVNLRPLNKP